MQTSRSNLLNVLIEHGWAIADVRTVEEFDEVTLSAPVDQGHRRCVRVIVSYEDGTVRIVNPHEGWEASFSGATPNTVIRATCAKALEEARER